MAWAFMALGDKEEKKVITNDKEEKKESDAIDTNKTAKPSSEALAFDIMCGAIFTGMRLKSIGSLQELEVDDAKAVAGLYVEFSLKAAETFGIFREDEHGEVHADAALCTENDDYMAARCLEYRALINEHWFDDGLGG